ncbi:hypothetical protein [Runella slithyformis]|uniref:hypothetical protein n=1 Tax=Runella slithyformis TaxID=106 RepID=UPI00146E0FD7|nr:hypothetical protein [Runella slithyformis]
MIAKPNPKIRSKTLIDFMDTMPKKGDFPHISEIPFKYLSCRPLRARATCMSESPNVWWLNEEADFGAQNCQHTTKVDAR